MDAAEERYGLGADRRADDCGVGLRGPAGFVPIGKRPVLVEWQGFPDDRQNTSFVERVTEALTPIGADREANCFLSVARAQRSFKAAQAMAAAGFTRCRNVADGFEGPLDHRIAIEGGSPAGKPRGYPGRRANSADVAEVRACRPRPSSWRTDEAERSTRGQVIKSAGVCNATHRTVRIVSNDIVEAGNEPEVNVAASAVATLANNVIAVNEAIAPSNGIVGPTPPPPARAWAKGNVRAGERRCAPCCGRDLATTSIRAGSASMEFENFDGRVVRATVPVKFLKNWIQSHYSDDLLQCCAEEFGGVERVEVTLRQPGMVNGRPSRGGGPRIGPQQGRIRYRARPPRPAACGAARDRP